MRILFSTYPLAFQNPGGGERVIRELTRSLTSLGHTVTHFTDWTVGAPELKSFDIIHYFSTVQPSFWHFAKRNAPHIPLLITPVLYLEPGWRSRLSYFKRRLREQLFQEGTPNHLPDHWLAATPYEQRLLNGVCRIDEAKISLQPNGVTPDFWNADPGPFLKATGIQTPFVLHVGRFHPVKNQLTLIEAVRRTRTTAVLIGDPGASERNYYSACVEAARQAEASDPKKGTSIQFIEGLDSASPLLPSSYAAATAFVLPSLFETFGISALEAAVSNTELILSDRLANPDLFKPYAHWIDPMNTQEIAQLITRCINSNTPASPEKKTWARKLFDQYSWTQIGRDLVKVYETLHREKQRGHS